jgi:hypothetical protein
MRRIIGITAATSLLALALAAPSFAADSKMKANPFTFDPDHTGIIVSAWQAHTGLPDAGGSDHGLVLQKNGLTATNAAAGAVVTGAEGQTANQPFGYDIKNGSHCGAGAPRFNLQASDGFHFLGGCANATQTPGPPGWTHVTIDPQNPAQAFPPVAATATIQSVAVLFDEGNDQGTGQAVIDNVVVNGNTPVGKPGNAK